jgi:glycosyltransferase involved in cell wall biosynthesis
MNMKEVSIIIPAFNEARTIGEVIETLQEICEGSEIIVVNDGSTDATGQVAKDAGALVYNHPYNIGNGAAIKTGIRIASGEVLVFMDGDGQHKPADVKRLLEQFPEFDMVVGARGGGSQASNGRAFGNWIYNKLASYVTKFRIQDLTSGFRAVKSDVARQFVYLLPNAYSYPTTLTLSVLRSGRSLKYVPISAQKRKDGKSKIKFFTDGIKFFLIITKICTLYSPLRVFLPISSLLFCLGVGYYAYTFLALNRFTNMSALLFSTSVIIFMMGLVSEQICQMRFERSEGNNSLV